MCLVVWSTFSGINIKSKHLCLRRHVTGRSRCTTPAGYRFIALSARRRSRISAPQLVADHSVASGSRISSSTVPRSKFRSVGKETSYVCTPQQISPDSLSGERFSTSADLELTKHQISPIQHR
ncbi:hypothetical protein TNCV_522301 [Trichonephila clavipes]|nr:hypothetical protein TNCV_522301 [Trichonephila clavipes]